MIIVEPSTLSGTLRAPPSKSHTMRALIFAGLARGKSRIYDPLISPDTEAMMEALRSFGANITKGEGVVEVEGSILDLFKERPLVIEAGNSGQVLRFVAALGALFSAPITVRGDHSRRPLAALQEGLCALGAQAHSTDGYAPFFVQGPICPGVATLLGEDSQPVSALLMAASFLASSSELKVRAPGEKPWIDLTLYWIRRFGGIVNHKEYSHYFIGGNLSVRPFEITIPGDYSSAAFPFVASLITQSSVKIENLDPEDVQGDKKLFDLAYEDCIDAGEMIDAVPILAVLGLFRDKPLRIIGAAVSRQKESDRLYAITRELRKMGARIEEYPDGLFIYPSKLKGALLESHKDHRIAMALIVAALGASTPSTIAGSSCISKSYPTFIRDFQSLGAKLLPCEEFCFNKSR